MRDQFVMRAVASLRGDMTAVFRAAAGLSMTARYDLLRGICRGLLDLEGSSPLLDARLHQVDQVIGLIVEWGLLEPSSARADDKSAEERRLLDLLGEMARIANGLSPERDASLLDLRARKLAA